MYRKTAFITILIFILMMSSSVFAAGAGSNDIKKMIEVQNESIELSRINESLKMNTGPEVKKILPGYDPENIIGDLAKGSVKFSIQEFVNNSARFIFSEIKSNMDIILKIIILAALCALLKNLQASFLSESVGELAFYTCYIVIISLLVVSFNVASGIIGGVIENMVTFMQAMIPSLIVLLTASGNIVSAGIFQPLLISVVEIAAVLMKNFVMPLIFLAFVASIVDNISDNIQITKICDFLKSLCTWTTGILLSLFVAVVSAYGALGATIDGVTSKTAKFAIGVFIPVVGKYLADAADAVVGSTLLIRNASGIAAMIAIVIICLMPLLKVFALLILYRVAAVIIEPVSDKRITKSISDIGNSLTYMIGTMSAVACMFLISLAAVIGSANISAMIR